MALDEFKGRRCLITGAASGIGRATALAAGREGATLFLTDLDDAKLDDVAASVRDYGGSVAYMQALDISAYEAVRAMAEEKLELQFFCQCDAQIADQEELMSLMAKANCWQIFVGVESFNRQTLLKAQKGHNHPEKYAKIVEMCREYGVSSHLSNIIGFWAVARG